MGKYNLNRLEERVEFAKKYLPRSEGFVWQMGRRDEVRPFQEPTGTCFGACVGHFIEGGLTLPLDPLILTMMKMTGIAFCHFTPNTIRVLTSVAALNESLEFKVGLMEILHCYAIRCRGETHFLTPWDHAPEVIRDLPSTQRGFFDRIVVVTGGPILPVGFEDFVFPSPSAAGAVIIPPRSLVTEINHRHLSGIISHDGWDKTLVHPRSYTRLLQLGGTLKDVSDRKTGDTWVGESMTDEEKMVFFARHGVENDTVREVEVAKRALSLGSGPEASAAKTLIAKVDAERALHQTYLDELARIKEDRSFRIRAKNAEIEAMVPTGAHPNQVLMLWGHEEVSVDEALEIITPPKARKRKAPETETERPEVTVATTSSQTKAPLTFTSRRAKLAKEKGLKKPKKTKAKVPTGVPKAGTTVVVEPEAEVTVATTSLALVPEVAVTVLDIHPATINLEVETSPVGED
jgi:hypothetical protein